MSSIVCQGLQSCLETLLIEPHVLGHKLAPSESNSSQMYHARELQASEEQINKKGDLGGWSSIQNHDDNGKVYVHPLVKRSSSKLSKKSLEMCTESLGCETGSDISDDFSPYFPSVKHSKPRQYPKKLAYSCSFPPPLTSISGSDSVRVRPHREHGRLVLKAETVAPNCTYLQAERVGGRLRLCMMVSSPLVCDYAGDDQLFHGNEMAVFAEECCGDDGDDNELNCVGGDVVRISGKSGSEFEAGESARPRGCKEGGGRGRKEMQSWGAVWVASS